METANFLTEHQFVLKEQQELVNEISKVDDKFANIDVIYNLETADEVLCAMASKFEKLNKLAMEYIDITSRLDPAYLKQIQQTLSNYEGNIGVIERDEKGNLHCGDCLVSYNHCQDLVGELVIISHITLNTNHHTRNKYKAFANQIDLVY